MKNIIICLDGTGNSPDKVPTNIYKIFKALPLESNDKITQLPFYFEGIGTGAFKPFRLVSQALGFGISRNVKRAYRHICQTYSPGDRIYIFGFSRGGFQAHILSELILHVGIIDRKKITNDWHMGRMISRAYFRLRLKKQTWLGRMIRAPYDKTRDYLERKFISAGTEYVPASDRSVRFLGLFDMVDASGLFAGFSLSDIINDRVYCYKIKNRHPDARIDTIRHAISLSDNRKSFHPFLYCEGTHPDMQTVLFAGEHSNIGGGLHRDGLSLIVLDWMMEEATRSGLQFSELTRQQVVEGSNLFDAVFDSRQNLRSYFRWQPRDWERWTKKYNMNTRIHQSLWQRIYAGLYQPDNLPSRGYIHPNGPSYELPTNHLRRYLKAPTWGRNITYWGLLLFTGLSIYGVLHSYAVKLGWGQTLYQLLSPNLVSVFVEIIKQPSFVIGLLLFYTAGEILKLWYANRCQRWWREQIDRVKQAAERFLYHK